MVQLTPEEVAALVDAWNLDQVDQEELHAHGEDAYVSAVTKLLAARAQDSEA